MQTIYAYLWRLNAARALVEWREFTWLESRHLAARWLIDSPTIQHVRVS